MPYINGKFYTERELEALAARELQRRRSSSDVATSAIIGAVTGSSVLGAVLGGSILGGLIGDLAEGTDDSIF